MTLGNNEPLMQALADSQPPLPQPPPPPEKRGSGSRIATGATVTSNASCHQVQDYTSCDSTQSQPGVLVSYDDDNRAIFYV